MTSSLCKGGSGTQGLPGPAKNWGSMGLEDHDNAAMPPTMGTQGMKWQYHSFQKEKSASGKRCPAHLNKRRTKPEKHLFSREHQERMIRLSGHQGDSSSIRVGTPALVVIPLDSYPAALPPCVSVFGGGASKEVMNIK